METNTSITIKKSVKVFICELIPLVIATIILLIMGMGEHKVLGPDLSGWESRYSTLQDGKWTASPDMFPEEAQEEGQIDLIYGPFITLPKGSYSVSIDYSCESPQTFEAHSFANGDAVVIHEEETLDPGKESITCHFTLKRAVDDMEIRIHYDGNGSAEIRNINIVSSTFLFREGVLFYAGLVFLVNAFLLLRDLYKRKNRLDGVVTTDKSIDRIRMIRKTVFSIVIFFITAVIVYKQIPLHSDYMLTYVWGRDVFQGYSHMSTYPMWLLLDKYIYELGRLLFGMTAEYSAAITSGLVNVASYLVIEYVIDKKKVKYPDIVSFALMFVVAIFMPWYNPDIYLGQGSPNIWHSATILMIKPFTVLTFVLAVELCEKINDQKEITRTDLILLTLLIFLGVVAKPCFFQGFVPALGMYIIAVLIRNKMKDFKSWLFIILTFVPAFLLVVLQFVATLFWENRSGGIGIGWMEVIKYFAPNPLFSLLLVMLFPLMYIILNFKKSIKKTDIILSLLFVACSYLEYALLYEQGERKYHGNFGWAANLSYLVAFIVTAGRFFKDWETDDMNTKKCATKNTVLLTVFLMHVAFGLYYVGLFLFKEGYKGFLVP